MRHHPSWVENEAKGRKDGDGGGGAAGWALALRWAQHLSECSRRQGHDGASASGAAGEGKGRLYSLKIPAEELTTILNRTHCSRVLQICHHTVSCPPQSIS